MSHYTLNSGVRSNTITSRCPVCLKVEYYTEPVFTTDTAVCCSLKCSDKHYKSLMALWGRAMKWGQGRYTNVGQLYIFNEYMVHVGR